MLSSQPHFRLDCSGIFEGLSARPDQILKLGIISSFPEILSPFS